MTRSERSPDRIALIGFMGAGKSVVACALGTRLGWTVADTDAEIERACGLSVREIFETRGEAAFRELERREVERTVERHAVVIALGGGAFDDGATRERVRATCHVVHLAAHPSTLRRRLGAGARTRPLLDDGFPDALLEARGAAYASAHVTVDTDGATPEAIAERIVVWWRSRVGEPHA